VKTSDGIEVAVGDRLRLNHGISMGAVRLDPLTGQAQGNGTGHFMVGDLGALLRYQAYAGVEYAVIEMDVAPGLEFWILDLSYRFLYEPRSASGGDANVFDAILAAVAKHATTVPTKRVCDCSMSTLMRDGCRCGAVTRYQPPSLA